MSPASILAAAQAQFVQVAALFALLWLLDALAARHGSTRLRSALWAVLLLKLALPPSLASPIGLAACLPQEWTHAPLWRGSTSQQPEAASQASSALAWILVWAVGCAACASLALSRARRARRPWIAGSRRAPAHARRLLRELSARLGQRGSLPLQVGARVHGAALVGLLRPRIVVSAELLKPQARDRLEHVLLHEVAHHRRRDAWRALSWTVAACVYWFHPAVHAGARRAALLREMACDELALRSARGGAQAYRGTLLELARPLVGPGAALQTGVAGMSRFTLGPSQIRARLERLARAPARPARSEAAVAWLVAATLCACCVPMAAAAPRAPALADVEGCMRVRYLVFAELAQQAGRRDSHSPTPSQETP